MFPSSQLVLMCFQGSVHVCWFSLKMLVGWFVVFFVKQLPSSIVCAYRKVCVIVMHFSAGFRRWGVMFVCLFVFK